MAKKNLSSDRICCILSAYTHSFLDIPVSITKLRDAARMQQPCGGGGALFFKVETRPGSEVTKALSFFSSALHPPGVRMARGQKIKGEDARVRRSRRLAGRRLILWVTSRETHGGGGRAANDAEFVSAKLG